MFERKTKTLKLSFRDVDSFQSKLNIQRFLAAIRSLSSSIVIKMHVEYTIEPSFSNYEYTKQINTIRINFVHYID